MKSERTRKFIVERAAPLFNCKGFEGTSMADLTEATGLTKGALYGNFEDKETLAREAFSYSVELIREKIADLLTRHETYKAKIEAVLDFFALYVLKPPIQGGCPLLNNAVEADDNRVAMRRVVAGEISAMVNFLASLIRKGIRAGEFKKDVNARELAYVIFCMVEGAIMYSRVEKSTEPMKIIINHCKKKLDEIKCR